MLKKHSCLLDIATNLPAPSLLFQALRHLEKHVHWRRQSPLIQGTDITGKTADTYYNIVAWGETALTAEELTAYAREVEQLLGRKRGTEAEGVVCADIDLLQYDGKTLRTEGIKRDYIQLFLREIE